jgi:hypothetical protein
MMKNRNQKGLSLSRIPDLCRTLVVISYIVLGFGTLYSNYLGQTYSETISFFVQDGWCNTGTQGIGIHCFGDFYQPSSTASESQPWSAVNATSYSPLNLFYFKILSSQLITGISTHASIVINILITVGALSLPGISLMRSKQKNSRNVGAWVIGLSLVSGPALMTIDRGSSSFLLFPLLYFFFNSIAKENQLQSLILLTFMVVWKPQALMFGLVILIVFGLRQFIKSIAISVGSFLLSFLFYPQHFISNILGWSSNFQSSQNYLPIPTPGSYTLVNSSGFLVGLIRWVKGESISLAEAFRPPLSTQTVGALTVSFGLLFLVLILINRKSISKNEAFLITTVLFVVLPTVTFGYYLILLLVPIIVILKIYDGEKGDAKLGFEWVALAVTYFFIVPAWPISWKNTVISVGPAWESFSTQWLLAHACVTVLTCALAVRLIAMKVKAEIRVNVFPAS